MNNNTINVIIKYSILIGLAIIPFIPLYVANSLFFPFITGKAFAFRIIVEIIFALWLVLVIREKGTTTAGTDRSVAPRINKMTVFVTSFTLIVLIADLAGLNPLRSIWSNSERMEGWMTIVHLWGYFMVISSIFGAGEEVKKNWYTFFNISIVAATIVALYGFAQYFGWAEIHQGSSRIDASLGNSAYMAVYMLIHAFLAWYMAGTKKLQKGLFWTYIVLGAVFTFMMFQTSTRGSMLGWIAGVLVACFIYAVWGRKSKGQSDLSRYVAGAVILLFVIGGTLFYFNREAKWIQKSEVLARLATISLSDTKTQARGYVWPMAVKGVFSNSKTAIIGLGQENFNYLFNENYNPKMWAHEQWFDRAHSVYLDWLVSAGVVGLVLYLSLYVLSLIYIMKSELSLTKKSLLVALLVGYSIHNIFVFDNQTSYVMFFTFLAYVHSLKSGKLLKVFRSSDKKISEDYIVVRDYIFVPVIALVFITGFYFVNVRNLQANTRLITALRSCSGGIPTTKTFESVLKLNQTTLNQETREQLISCSINVISSDKVSDKTKGEFYELTKKEVEEQIKDSPNDARIYVLAGSFFNSINDWGNSLSYLEKARTLTPGKQAVAFDLVVNYINTNKPQDAVDIAKSAYESAPEYPVAQTVYVLALINNNEEKKAHEIFPDRPDLFSDQRIVSIYMRKGQYSKAIAIYKEMLAKDPKDVQTRSYLASAYLQSKQNWLAIQELKTIKENSPELRLQIDEAIKSIEEGKNPL